MDVALDLHHDFRSVKLLGDLLAGARHRLIELCVAAFFRQCMDIMQSTVTVQDIYRLTCLNAQHVRLVDAAFLVNDHRFRRSRIVSLDSFLHIDEHILKFAARSGQKPFISYW